MKTRLGLLLLAVCAPACAPRGQVQLYIDTDAPLALGPGQEATGLIPLFDRVRFDVYPPGENNPCSPGCSPDLPLTQALVKQGNASIGIVPQPNREGYRVRVRVYHAGHALDGDPLERSSLEAWVALPPVENDDPVAGNVFLPTERVGRPLGSRDAPIALEPGAPAGGRAGTWPGAQRIDCDGTARDHEVCVPGGAFWMGDPSVVGNVALDDFPSPRLVVLAPFFIDIDELSVGEARRWLREHDLNWSRSDDPDPVPWSEDEDYTLAVDHHCTLPGDLDDPSRDSLPVNCLSHARAQAICASRDGDLPTEAQLEYVAGELEGASHAWRDQPPSCSEAVFARGGTRSFFQSFPDSCLEPTSSGGVKPIGWGTRDRVDVGGVDVRGLAGNVAELARDRWSRQSASACWDFFLKDNPICDAPDDGEGGSSWVVRSGSWPWPSYTLDAAFRAEARLDFEDTKTRSKLGPHVGFRCARDE